MENKESGIPQELLGKIRLLVFLEGLESWARDSWRKNPRLIEFYKMSRLSQVASDLEDYDRDDAARDSWRKGRPVPSFDGKDFGFITVAARNRAELKKKLMDAARSFLPDPEVRSPALDDFFCECGKRWMLGLSAGHLPECWQDFYDCCLNPCYDGSLSWDDDE